MSTPLYRERMGRRAPEADTIEQAVSLARLYHNVFGSPEGMKVLDDICMRLCHIDDAFVVSDPLMMADSNGRRNVGVAIATLALGAYDDSKPEVRG